jgi:hypothetical protein
MYDITSLDEAHLVEEGTERYKGPDDVACPTHEILRVADLVDMPLQLSLKMIENEFNWTIGGIVGSSENEPVSRK